MKTIGILAFGLCLVSGTAVAAPRTHDGFYMQVTGGVGYYKVSGEADASISGLTFPNFGLMMGGTLAPGLVLGGGFFVDYSSSPSIEQGGVSGDLGTAQLLLGLGAHADYYLDPAKGGLHFQGFLGWGGLEETEGTGGSDPTGLVIALGAGYDWWIGDEWSVGVLGRLAYAPLKFNDASYTTIAPALLGTLTWH
jgi:hypothetical protein